MSLHVLCALGVLCGLTQAQERRAWCDRHWGCRKLPTASPGASGPVAKVWMAVASGAKGIGYFTIAFNPFEWNNLTPEMEETLPRINGRLKELAPVILSPPAKEAELEVVVEGEGGTVQACRRDYGGSVYVIAVNPTRQPVTAQFKLRPGQVVGPVEVLYERRRLPVTAGAFADEFDPLAVHIYRAAMPSTQRD